MGKVIDFEQSFEEQDSLASARWADPAYIAMRYAYEPGAIWFGRNPHNPSQAIGHKDDMHVFIGAETRSGKGTSFLVNNQILWPGSLITVGPKGEEATITALRRGDGGGVCEGLNQKVYVLDPMRCADVPEDMRAHFNPLSALDPEDGELSTKCNEVADAICKIDAENASSGEDSWQEEARDYVALVIKHVVSSPMIRDDRRDLLTVRDLVTAGNVEGAERLYEYRRAEAIEAGEDPAGVSSPDPFWVLLYDMCSNEGCRGTVAREASSLRKLFNDHIRYFESIRGSAKRQLTFLDGEGIENTVRAGYPNTFDVDAIKNERISIFISLPEKNYPSLDRWLRLMVVVLFQSLQEQQGLPANGERVLFCIDEFANLGKMRDVGMAINSIAGAGVKLMISTQRIGDLKAIYGEAWEKFSASAAQMWFGANEMATRKHLEDLLGKTEVVKYARNIGKSSSLSHAEGVTNTYTHTQSQSDSETVGTATSRAIGKSRSSTNTQSRSKGSSENYGTSDGRSANASYGPGIFWHGFQYSPSTGRNSGTNRNKGTSDQSSTSQGVTQGDSITNTESQNQSYTRQRGSSESWARGTTTTDTSTEGQSAGIQESYHVKPLLSSTEIREQLAPVSRSDLDHPAYPGMALVYLPNELPFFVRRANYFEDPYFENKFRPNPAHEFIALDDLPLMGWQITDEYFYTLQIPDRLRTDALEIEVVPELRSGEYLPAKEPLVSIRAGSAQKIRNKAPDDLKVISVMDDEERIQTGSVMVFRFDRPISQSLRAQLDQFFWGPWLKQTENREEQQIHETGSHKKARILFRREVRDIAAAAKIKTDQLKILSIGSGVVLGVLTLALLIFLTDMRNDAPVWLWGLVLLGWPARYAVNLLANEAIKKEVDAKVHTASQRFPLLQPSDLNVSDILGR